MQVNNLAIRSSNIKAYIHEHVHVHVCTKELKVNVISSLYVHCTRKCTCDKYMYI